VGAITSVFNFPPEHGLANGIWGVTSAPVSLSYGCHPGNSISAAKQKEDR